MKKILTVILFALLIVAAFFGYRYWNATYNGKTSYAVVKTTPPRTETVDADGKKVTDNGQQLYSYDYTFEFVREDGSKVTVPFEISALDPKPLTQGIYITGKVSQTRVVEGPSPVAADKVPQTVKDQLK